MRASIPTPTAEPLPFRAGDDPLPGSHAPPGRPTPAIRGAAVARFDAFLHELNPDAVRVDIDRMQHLLDWLLSLHDADAHHVLDRRLQRIEELRTMLGDPDWDADDAMRARLGKLFAYLDRDDAGHEPMLGLLDDVLLIELAWPAFAVEAEEYRDFCAYRNDERSAGSGDTRRSAWIRDRLAEIALWRHQVRVHDSHYVHRGHPEALFRVG